MKSRMIVAIGQDSQTIKKTIHNRQNVTVTLDFAVGLHNSFPVSPPTTNDSIAIQAEVRET